MRTMLSAKGNVLVLFALVAMIPSVARAEGEPYSPYVDRDFPTSVYFGDMHLHTSVSLDAYGDGNTTVGPDEAYRWAKGEIIAGDDGVPTRISSPLDFVVIADHAEYMGLVPGLARNDPALVADPAGARLARLIDEGKLASQVFAELVLDITSNSPQVSNPTFESAVWRDSIAVADRHDAPGRFSAFIGFEYSAFPDGDNLHRVVVFRDGAERAGRVKPFSAFDSNDPEDLWAWMQAYEDATGGQILAVPHNGNLSGGRMFALSTVDGEPLDQAYAKTRKRWEPIYEVTQYKGDGETHPFLSPDDEFADFETWDKANLAMLKPHEDAYYPFEYARSALKLGLGEAERMGVNPFQFGLVGATDSHTGFAAGAEDNFLGKYGAASPRPDNTERWKKEWPPLPGVVATMKGWESQSGGYTAVWARENTREALFDAMMRKEVYATTGPRMVVRFFGGFELDEMDADRHDFVARGYAKGVPMGGTLAASSSGDAPTFVVSALKDANGANLDRIQIVKGWLDAAGELQERVHDIALSDGRWTFRGKALQRVGSTVDLPSATYENTIGAAVLRTGWTDPDFDPSERAFYYVRVIEIPTPRWTAIEEARFGIEMDEEVVRVIQERAYTSPIWYEPRRVEERP